MKGQSSLGSGGTLPGDKMDFSIFLRFAKGNCVCLKAVGQFPVQTTRWRSCLKNILKGSGTQVLKFSPLNENVEALRGTR